MATEEFIASISTATVEDREALWANDPARGADLRFLGVVREMENGLPIAGIHYSCYPGMAGKELESICQSLRQGHGEHRALIHHRVGFVPAGMASLVTRVLVTRVRTTHSTEAFELVREYLRRIKTTVPVWKSVQFSEPVADA